MGKLRSVLQRKVIFVKTEYIPSVKYLFIHPFINLANIKEVPIMWGHCYRHCERAVCKTEIFTLTELTFWWKKADY